MHSIAFEFSPQVCVTGGACTIEFSAHTCLEMLQEGYEVVVLDSLYNATREALKRVEELTGKTVTFVQLDIGDAAGLDKLFTETKFDAVIHFAGLKAVGESVAKPLFYYENNIGGTVNLLKAMAKGDCKSIVFSSSATVYGDPASVPVQEDFPISATNPYAARRARIRGSGGASASATAASSNVCSWLCFAPFVLLTPIQSRPCAHRCSLRRHRRSYGRTKLFIEEILRDVHRSDNSWNVILLRYFNPVGAHKSGKIGEDQGHSQQPDALHPAGGGRSARAPLRVWR